MFEKINQTASLDQVLNRTKRVCQMKSEHRFDGKGGPFLRRKQLVYRCISPRWN